MRGVWARTWGAPAQWYRIGTVFTEGEPGFERAGELKATGDAGEDQRDAVGAEADRDVDVGFGGGKVLHRGGELFAESDECAEDAEQVGGAGGCDGGRRILRRIGGLGWLGDGGRGGHGQEESTMLERMSRKIFLVAIASPF